MNLYEFIAAHPVLTVIILLIINSTIINVAKLFLGRY
ncbi:hypothetical protein [Escherichia phage CLB_P3]|nr:hypothetical protein BPP3_70 [Escherichia phage CLB_P3]UNI73358.1 hypothetical protein [Escherichia phage CLB_P3]